jgi:hypothetical protein
VAERSHQVCVKHLDLADKNEKWLMVQWLAGDCRSSAPEADRPHP